MPAILLRPGIPVPNRREFASSMLLSSTNVRFTLMAINTVNGRVPDTR